MSEEDIVADTVMQKPRFEDAVREIRRQDRRFDHEAYLFLRDALDVTVTRLRGDESEEHQDVTGVELLCGLRDHALSEFGPMAATVLESWGIRSTDDVGEMVFQLIEAGAFGKSDTDTREDFAGVYDFDAAFREPFRPSRQASDEVRLRDGGADRTERSGRVSSSVAEELDFGVSAAGGEGDESPVAETEADEGEERSQS